MLKNKQKTNEKTKNLMNRYLECEKEVIFWVHLSLI